MRRSTRQIAALSVVAALALPLAACSGGGGGGAEAEKNPPAKLIAVTGTDQKQVVLTPKAAERIGLQTSPAAEGSHAGGPGNDFLVGGSGDDVMISVDDSPGDREEGVEPGGLNAVDKVNGGDDFDDCLFGAGDEINNCEY